MWAESWRAENLPSWNDKPQIYCSSLFFFSCITERPKYQRRNSKWLNWHFRRRWRWLVQGAEATRAERQKSEDRTEAGTQRKAAAHIEKKEDSSRSRGNKGMRNWKYKWVSPESEQENEIPGKTSPGMVKILRTKRHPNTSLKAQPFKKEILHTMPYLTASLLTTILKTVKILL